MMTKRVKLFSVILMFFVCLLVPVSVYAEHGISSNSIDSDDEGSVKEALYSIVEKNPVLVLAYGNSICEIKAEPQKEAAVINTVYCGEQLWVKDFDISSDGIVFYLVEGMKNGTVFCGYIESVDIVTNDDSFNTWRQEELSKLIGYEMSVEGSTASDIMASFPKGYHSALIQLSNIHPNWIFVPFNTGLDFSEVVANERVGSRSLVYRSVEDSWKSKESGDYNSATGEYIGKSGANWVRASQLAVEYCLNPINYLDENHIFAFEQLTFNQNAHNASGVNAIIQKSWMYNRALEDGSGGLYCDVFMQVGQNTGISPYHLAGRVLQEQGIAGTSALISGYGGVYNYFNVQATGRTEEQILTSGTNYALSQGWTTRYRSIEGGSIRLGENYITKGQDTLYLQKFDVEPTYYGLYSHQYMQNIQAPTTESVSVYKAYNSAGAINAGYVFKIPVYLNMPGNGVDPAGVESYITRLYQVILDRKPDAEGIAYWKNSMMSGTSAAAVAFNFFNSPEMKNKKLNDSEYLDYAYLAILGRKADESGKAYWMNELAAGSTRNNILKGFLYSPEFTSLCNNYGVIRGTIDNMLRPSDLNANQTQFVVRLYRNILKREPDQEGLDYWTKELQNGLTASVLVNGFVTSNEFINSKIKDEDYIEILYMTILNRASDSDGKAYWVKSLNTGTNRQTVLKGFLGSPEFRKLCASYQISVE